MTSWITAAAELIPAALPLAGPTLAQPVQVAIVGGIFGTIGVMLSVLLDKSKRRPNLVAAPPPEHDDDDDRLWDLLTRRAETAEERLTDETARAWRYRDQLLRAGIEPHDHPPRPRPTTGAAT